MPLPHHNLVHTAPARLPLQRLSCDARFSWASECRHLFSQRFVNICWWPIFHFRQRRLTRSALFQSCSRLPGFNDLWKTIQKGSFAYNSLFLGLTAFRPSRATDLADITTLALFFGDEFIDGLANTAGKSFIRDLMGEHPERFYLKKRSTGTVSLQYRFDLNRLLPGTVMKTVNTKYGITYEQFLQLMHGYLSLINKSLKDLPRELAEKTADKIADACNTCFKSFLHDVYTCHENGALAFPHDVIQFHEMKTAYMQTKLLELRCILIGREEAMTSIQTPGWIDLMRVIQIYDDIHDALIDHRVQDNLLLSVAAHYFPDEWEWYCTRKDAKKKNPNEQFLLSLYMPCSMEYCQGLAAEKIKSMNWEQQKIMHYLLFKHRYVLYTEPQDEVVCRKQFLRRFYERIREKMSHLPEEHIKSFAVDTCIHVNEVRRQIIGTIDFSTAYQLRFNLFAVPERTKAVVFDQLTKK